MGDEPRKGRWLPLVYYYLGAVVGLAITLVGVIGGLQGLVTAALPQISSEARYSAPERVAPDGKAEEPSGAEQERLKEEAVDRARLGGFDRALRGAVTAVVGAPVFFWHLRQARRREPAWLGAAAPQTTEG